MCSHGRLRSNCVDCGGSSICEHGRQRYKCIDCKGFGICEHGKQRYSCRDCQGSGICEHGKQHAFCADCNGSQACRNNSLANCGHRANAKFDKFCTFCFANLFPNDPRTATIHSKSKEIKWVNALLQSAVLADHEWTWDKPFYASLSGGCCDTKRRIDLWAIIEGYIVAIEIDENQHKYRELNYEEMRYNDLVMDFTGRYVFLRINPDPYKVAGVKHDPSFEERLASVEEKLAEILTDIASGSEDDSRKMVDVLHMFYDE